MAVFLACSGRGSGGGGADSPVYWTVRTLDGVYTNAAFGQDAVGLVPRLLDDGAVIAVDSMGAAWRLEPSGARTAIAPPVPGAGLLALGNPQVTWYADARNFGGITTGGSQAVLSGGWAVLDGALRECVGTACVPVLRRADGSLVTRDWSGRWWQTWTPGQAPGAVYPLVDELDIHAYRRDLGAPCFGVRRVSAEGSVLGRFQINGQLECSNNQGDLASQFLLKDFVNVDLSKASFNRGGVELDTCCDVMGLNDRGQLLGLRDGRPVIKTGDTYEEVSSALGFPAAFNTAGDVLFRDLDPVAYHLRWQGAVRTFPACEVQKQLPTADDPGTFSLDGQALDLNAAGQVLFWRHVGGAASEVQLLVATPRTELARPEVSAQLRFDADGGVGAPAALQAWAASGSLEGGAFAVAIRGATGDRCVDATFSASASRSAGAWAVGDLIPATTAVTAGGVVIGVASYTDGALALHAVAGGFRVVASSPSGFTVRPEGLVLQGLTGGARIGVEGEVQVAR